MPFFQKVNDKASNEMTLGNLVTFWKLFLISFVFYSLPTRFLKERVLVGWKLIVVKSY